MTLRLSQAQIAMGVAGALLLATNVYLGITYLGSLDQRGRLVGQHQALRASIDRLAASQSEPATATEPGFPKSPPGLELTDLVVRSAGESGVEILGLRAGAPGVEQLGQGTYQVVKVDLRLRADPDRLIDFLDRMERGGVATLVFDNVDVVRVGGAWEIGLELLAYSAAA